MAVKYYWEDFKVGDRAVLGERTLEKDEIIQFAKQFDPQAFHVDEQAAEKSFFGGIIASGWHTCGLAMRMMCDAYLVDSASLGSPGVDNIRWLKPVRPGDTLRFEREFLESRPSSSKPDVGILKTRWEVFNQRNEMVMSMEGVGLFKRRHPSTS
ncbi:MAG: MaoC family dehydratase [Burkholderiales bacterium]